MSDKPPTASTPRSPRSAKGVKVSSLLAPETVLVAAPGSDKAAILENLITILCAARGLGDPAPFLAEVMKREQGISTTLDTGLSIPHARITEGLAGIVAALTAIPQGVPDPKQPDLMIRVMFLFLSPHKPDAFPLHLQLLRAASSLFKGALIDQIVGCASGTAVLDLLRKVEG